MVHRRRVPWWLSVADRDLDEATERARLESDLVGPATERDPSRRARRATEQADAYLEARRRRLRDERARSA